MIIKKDLRKEPLAVVQAKSNVIVASALFLAPKSRTKGKGFCEAASLFSANRLIRVSDAPRLFGSENQMIRVSKASSRSALIPVLAPRVRPQWLSLISLLAVMQLIVAVV